MPKTPKTFYNFDCYACGMEIRATKRTFASIAAFAEFVNRVHRCSGGNVDARNPSASNGAEDDR